VTVRNGAPGDERHGLWLVTGPPGTGKTTYLAHQAQLAAAKHGSDSVDIASLTRAAAEIGPRHRNPPLERRHAARPLLPRPGRTARRTARASASSTTSTRARAHPRGPGRDPNGVARHLQPLAPGLPHERRLVRARVALHPTQDAQLRARRSHVHRWLTSAVAGAVIAAGIAIVVGDEPDARRPPSSNPASTESAVPSYPHDYWKFYGAAPSHPRDWTYSDPRRRKGAGGAPIR
jgi:hypothetical protein